MPQRMNRPPLSAVLAMLVAAFAGAAGARAAATELNWFEWCGIAPVVVAGEAVGEEGRYTALRVDRSLRGGIEPGTVVLIDIREMNRSRNRDLYRKASRLALETPYVVLLEPSDKQQAGQVIYAVVRGIKGSRALPPEGGAAVLQALERFVGIQDARSEAVKWRALAEMLDEGNPILLENALDQFIKFRRGDAELSLSVVPLLDHPGEGLRMRAAELLGQIVEREGPAGIPEEQTLRGELFALARRDPVPAVRLAACRALVGFPDRGVEEVLREVAEKDPVQDVRYEAEKLLWERREAAGDSARAGRG